MSYEVVPIPQDVRESTSTKDTGNSTLMSSVSGLTFPGAWYDLRHPTMPEMRLVAAQECVVVPLNIDEDANGPLTITFNFKFSDDGINPTVNEDRPIQEFGSLSNYSLKNVGNHFRASLTLSRALVGSELVALATDQWFITPPPFVRLASQTMEEQNAAFPAQFVFPQGFGDDGKSKNIRSTYVGELRVHDESLKPTDAGSIPTTVFRDDITISFSRDTVVDSIANKIQDAGSVGGAVAPDFVQGRAVFSTGAAAGNTVYFESVIRAIYEADHTNIASQTIEISRALVGADKVEWGWGEKDGSGNILNGYVFGRDATDLYIARIKAGVYANFVYRLQFNREKMNGILRSRWLLNNMPAGYNALNNTLYRIAYAWLGIAPPIYSAQPPAGGNLVLHVEETGNQQTGTTVPEPRLHLFVRAYNASGTDLSVACGSWRGAASTSKQIPTTISAGVTSGITVTATAQMIMGKRVGRLGASLINSASSARAFRYGYTSGVTATTGYELAPGAAADRGWGPDIEIWVVQAGGSGTVTAMLDEGA